MTFIANFAKRLFSASSFLQRSACIHSAEISHNRCEALGLHFGRTFCNCLRGLALTFLREWDAAQGWQMVGKRFADKPKLNLITNKSDVLPWRLCRRLEIRDVKRGYRDLFSGLHPPEQLNCIFD